MHRITVKFGDEIKKQFTPPISIFQIIQETFPEKIPSVIAAVVNGRVADLSEVLDTDAELRLLTFENEQGKEIFWHSSSHIMAHAVLELFPEAKLGIGPAIANGFYYDFFLDRPLTTEDFPLIEAKIQEIISANYPFERQILDRKEALALFQEKDQPFKVELVQEIQDGHISIYKSGPFIDLCRGPHVPSTGIIRHVKLLNVAGAYWHGDERNPVMQRIYGISFPDEKKLETYLTNLEEAKKRDHRRLGKELDLFSFQPEGVGFPFWHPNGMVLYNMIMDALRAILVRRGYQEIKTPILLHESLWHTSGHWEHYRENMYFTKIEEDSYAVKPMNCPGGVLVYRNSPRSYRDLPLKLSEMGLVHRHEKSGVLHGLFRVRQFTQDDAHVFCTPEQLETEIIELIDLIAEVYRLFGFEQYTIEVSTRPAKSIGTDAMWELAEQALTHALETKNVPYKINPGEGAFYGPKIDYHIQDSLGRLWQCGTIQVDFSMPERFGLEYIGPDGLPHRPVMVHRAILGSVERFIGILIEHYGGAFPVWLAPVQCIIIPISEKYLEYAHEIQKQLIEMGVRSRVDDRNEKMGYKIREAEHFKVPYMIIVGEKETTQRTVSIRRHRIGDIGTQSLEAFLQQFTEEIKRRESH